jgi:alpha-galactosidase
MFDVPGFTGRSEHVLILISKSRVRAFFRRLPLLIALTPVFRASALTNGLALTAPMGWNDWNTFGCGISDSIVRQTADTMATNGMKAAGYQFVNIDDCWAAARDANGVVVVNTSKFPNGIKAVADYVHSKGLKLGLYTDHGTNTCSGSNPPGSFGYEYLDAMTYASWGVDYLKNDSCKLPAGDVPQEDYFRMADGLMKSGRAIVNSLCPNTAHYEYWSPDEGNLWRTTGDINSTFSSMVGRIDPNSKSAFLAGPGRWNDPDMLEIGNGEFTDVTNAQSHFTMWCLMAAPLIAGNDLRSASPQTLAVLTNPEAIAVDQDPAGEQGIRVGGIAGSAEVWSKPLGYDFTTRAVALFNRTTNAISITCYWTNLALQAGTAAVRDLWAHADLGTFNGSFTTNVPARGVVLLKIVGTPSPPPSAGTNYLSDLQPIYSYTGFGTLTKDRSIGGNTITLNGVTYSKGIGTHAIGGHEYNLGGIASRFKSDLGIDDESGTAGSVIFQVFADGTKIYDSGIMTGSSATKTVDLDVTGVRRLTLGVTDTGNDVTGNRNANDHSDWAGARIIVSNSVPALPAAPTGLSAIRGNVITLLWNNTLAAISYNVKRSISSGGPYSLVTNVPVAAFADSNVVNGATYYYVVSALSSFGEGSNSLPVNATACLPPATPGGLQTTQGLQQVNVRWNAAAGASGYTLTRFTRNTAPVVIADGLGNTNYVDTNVVSGTVYFYLVAATNACGQSSFSPFAAGSSFGAPAAPSGLTATPGDASVSLVWFPSTQADSYKVKRSPVNGGPYLTIASNLVATGLLDTGLANGTTYYYVVSASNAAGESADSPPVSAMPNTNLPTGLVAWLTFDDGTAADSSGFGNHGTLMNGATVVTDATRGNVLFLDGVDNFVDLGTNASLDLSGSSQATIAAWIRTAASKNHNSVLSKGEWKEAYSLLVKGDTTPKDLLWTGNDVSVFSGDAIPLNVWTHVAVTINGALTTFYLNGQINGAANQNRGNPIDNTPAGVSIGREQYSGSMPAGRWFFDGLVDEVRIYRRTLTPAEIRNIATSTAPPISAAISVVGNHVVLNWSGGVAPFQVQVKTNLLDAAWQNYGGPIGSNSLILSPGGAAGFYRIQSP